VIFALSFSKTKQSYLVTQRSYTLDTFHTRSSDQYTKGTFKIIPIGIPDLKLFKLIYIYLLIFEYLKIGWLDCLDLTTNAFILFRSISLDILTIKSTHFCHTGISSLSNTTIQIDSFWVILQYMYTLSEYYYATGTCFLSNTTGQVHAFWVILRYRYTLPE
jgi:hypothetical protein